MGFFDDAMKNAVPGGNLATPIAVAAGALMLGKLFGGGSAPAPAPQPRPRPQPVPTNVPAGSMLGGLTDLIGNLTAGGAAPHVNSWVGPGANEPIQPGQLGSALGPEYAQRSRPQRTGMSQQELLEPARGRAAAAHQQSDAERPRADAGRARTVTLTRSSPPRTGVEARARLA